MKKYVSRITSNKLFADNSVAFIGSMVTSGLNYLFYPILGRFLNATQFGEVQVIATITVQAGLLFGLARIAIIGEVLQAKNKQDSQAIVQFSERLLLQLSLLLTLVAVILAPFMATKLQLGSVVPLYIVMPTLVLSAIKSSRDSYMRAYGHFGFSAIAEIATASSKLFIATLLAVLGMGTAGALWGLVGAYAVSALLLVVLTARLGFKTQLQGLFTFDAVRGLFTKGTVSKKGVKTLSVSAASLVVVVISSIDTIFSKLALPPQTAGLYTGISVVGNIALFATGSIAGVLLASISPAGNMQQNISKYKQSALLTIGLGVGIVAASVALPKFIISVMLGSDYTPLSNLLPALSVAMFAMSGINLIISYHIAMRDLAILPIAIVSGVTVVGSLALGHATPDAIAASFLRGNVISLILCIGWTLYWHKRVKHNHETAKQKAKAY